MFADFKQKMTTSTFANVWKMSMPISPENFFNQIFAECSHECHFCLPKLRLLTRCTCRDTSDLVPFLGPFFELTVKILKGFWVIWKFCVLGCFGPFDDMGRYRRFWLRHQITQNGGENSKTNKNMFLHRLKSKVGWFFELGMREGHAVLNYIHFCRISGNWAKTQNTLVSF